MTVKTGKQNEIKLEPKKKTEKDYLAIFEEYYKDFNVVDARHDLFEELEFMGHNHHGEKIDRPVMKVTLKSCPECGWPVKANDYKHGAVSCEGCGLVLNHIIFQEAPENLKADKKIGSKRIDLQAEKEWHGNYNKLNPGFKETINRLNKVAPYHLRGDDDCRTDAYYAKVDVIASQLHMNTNQSDIIKHVLNTWPMKTIHSRVGYQTIIAGLCRYLLCKEGHTGGIRFNIPAFRDNGLNKDNYEIIKNNIKRLKIFEH